MGWLRWNMQRVLGVPKINQATLPRPILRSAISSTPVEEVAHDWGLKVKIVESNKEVHFYSGRQYRGTTICRSMEKPDTIVGFKIGNALVDELDVLKADKASGVAKNNRAYAL